LEGEKNELLFLKATGQHVGRIGIMQGRLLPAIEGRIQAFPALHWRDEFFHAKRLGFSSIEWIWESPLDCNPLWLDRGREEIRSLSALSGVRISYICADYFMEVPFVRMSHVTLESNRRLLDALIESASSIGTRGIEIPCVDASALSSVAEEDELAFAIAPALDTAHRLGLEIGLETSLPPARFRALLERIGHPAIKANYDTGNSASLGYNAKEEIDAYGKWINNVHIKDRILGGTTVPLGTGNADIPGTLRLLEGAGYKGEFILQAARGSNDCETASNYKHQLEKWLAAL
jgi:hexulose-6-phosphate isomerase